MNKTSRQHVLAFLDKRGSEGRRLADAYRTENGLKVKDRCIYCNEDGHHGTCPESDRVGFRCSNYTAADWDREYKREIEVNGYSYKQSEFRPSK